MKIKELINEAISVSHLEEKVSIAIKSGIALAIGNLYDLKGQFGEAEEEFNEGDTSSLRLDLVMELEAPEKSMGVAIANEIKKAVNKEVGKDAVVSVVFTDTGNAYGTAQGRNIELNSKILKKIVRTTMESLVQIVLDNYGEGELTPGLWFVIKSIGAGDREYMYSLYSNETNRRIAKLSSTMIHEMVHVAQHARQDAAGRNDHEYRSYLDKRKGEFLDLHNAKHGDEATANSADDSRYFELYMASPQEIASFSHEIAIQIVDEFGLKTARTLEEFNNILRDVDAESIIDYVKQKVGKYYHKPQSKKEYTVFKRYVKLVYTEVQGYAAKRKEYLSKTLNERAVGKKMGHDLYVHKNYVAQTPIPVDALKVATSKLPKDYDYTAVKYNKADGSFSFIQSPDFDTADEPTVGVSLKVSAEGNVKRTNPPSDPWIWHNKWMWVGDDYSGFDVEQAKARSKKWKDVIGVDKAVSSRIGKKSYWDNNIVPKLK